VSIWIVTVTIWFVTVAFWTVTSRTEIVPITIKIVTTTILVCSFNINKLLCWGSNFIFCVKPRGPWRGRGCSLSNHETTIGEGRFDKKPRGLLAVFGWNRGETRHIRDGVYAYLFPVLAAPSLCSLSPFFPRPRLILIDQHCTVFLS